MIEQDTIKLLRECDAGVKMGIEGIEEVLDYAKDEKLLSRLRQCKNEHDRLSSEILSLLKDYDDDGKNPSPIAEAMSWIKTNAMLAMKESDHTIADLITDGCNMGVKSLSRYLNQYKAASEQAKDIAKKLIRQEELLAIDLRDYL